MAPCHLNLIPAGAQIVKRILIPAMALALFASCAQAPSATTDAALATITEHELEAHLRFLSHDLVEGRAPGTRGGDLAADQRSNAELQPGAFH